MATNDQLKQMQAFIQSMREVNKLIGQSAEGAKYLDRILASLDVSFGKYASGKVNPSQYQSAASIEKAMGAYTKLKNVVRNTDSINTKNVNLNDLIKKLDLLRDLQVEVEKLASAERKAYQEEKQKEAQRRADNAAKREAKRTGQPVGANVAGGSTANRDEGGLGNAETKAETRRREAAEAKAIREDEALRERIASLKREFGAETYKKLMARAQAKGFGPETVSKIHQDAVAGVTDVTFRDYKSLPGVVKEATATIDASGNISDKVAKRFQGLAAGVRRNVLEFTKWSIAVALILGPLRKMQELAQATVQQQDKLVDVTIAMGTAQKKTNQIYEEAYKVAQQVSTEVGDVVEAYTLAYRATGGVSDETERFATATKLLTDSMMLSKLSGMQESDAIDTLTASLKQASDSNTGYNYTLNDGTILLDKWVQATKIANIDLESLATAFAVVGDVSSKAGMDTESLIGLIAALGETGIASGRELANMGKAVVSGFQSDTGSKQLESFGIALTQVNGQAREFMDVMDQVAALQKEGIITATQYSELTLALGGGVRRQAVWSTLIENWERVREVASGVTDDKVAGVAQDAMSKKYETAASAITRMGNALSKLSMTMANEGGLLETFSTLTDLLTGIVNGLDKVTGAVGKATPYLLALGGAIMMGKDKRMGILHGMQSVFSGVVGGTAGRVYATAKSGGDPNAARMAYTSEGWQSTPIRQTYGENVMKETYKKRQFGPFSASYADMGTVAAFTVARVLSDLSDKTATDMQRKSRATAGGIGSIAGAAIGAATGITPVAGSIIGNAIATAFVNATIAKDVEFEAFFDRVIKLPGEEGKEEGKSEAQTREEAKQNLIKQLQADYSNRYRREAGRPGINGGAGVAWMGQLNAWADSTQENIELRRNLRKEAKERGISYKELIDKEYGGIVPKYGGEEMMAKYASPEAKKLIEKFESEYDPTGYIQTYENVKLQSEFKKKYGEYLGKTQKEYQEEILRKLASGEITSSEYATAEEAIRNANVSISNQYVMAGKEIGEYTGQSPQEVIEGLLNIRTYGTEEQKNALNSVIAKYNELTIELQDGTLTVEERAVAEEEQAAMLEALNVNYATLNNLIAQQIQLMGLYDYTGINKAQYESLVPDYNKRLRDVYMNTAPEDKRTEADFAKYIESLNDVVLELANGEFMTVRDFDPNIFADVYGKAEEAGKITDKSKGIDFRVMQDVSLGTLNTMFAKGGAYEQMLAKLTSVGYVSKEENMAVILDDQQIHTFNKDWKIVEYLLSQILDVEEKALETNLYNFPAGMTAYVPWGAVNTTLQQGGGGGSGLDLSGFLDEVETKIENTLGMGGIPADADLSGLDETPLISQYQGPEKYPRKGWYPYSGGSYTVEDMLEVEKNRGRNQPYPYSGGSYPIEDMEDIINGSEPKRRRIPTHGSRPITKAEETLTEKNGIFSQQGIKDLGSSIGQKIKEWLEGAYDTDAGSDSSKKGSGTAGKQNDKLDITPLRDLFLLIFPNLSELLGGQKEQSYVQPQNPMANDNTKITSTNLTVDVTSTTQVILDNGVLARAVSRAIANQMVRTANAGSSAVRINVI